VHLGAGDIAGLAAAGFAAGAINSAAGGGSLISFPTLVAVGYPALVANVTNTVALCPGYVGGVLQYRRELGGQRPRLIPLTAVSVAGAVAGAALLGATSQAVFHAVAPALVLTACALLALQPAVKRRLAHRGGQRRPVLAAQLPAAIYGAYFGAGLGVVVLAILAALVDDTLQRLNAAKAWLSLAVNVVAAAWFIAFDSVKWEAVAVIAPASLLGGPVGVFLARRLSDRALRWSVVAFGIAASAYLATTI
jgi:uncharacterized membrane protein YfcA